jgi:phage terminase large subunit
MLVDVGLKKGKDEIIADPANSQSIAYLKTRGWNIRGAKKVQGSVNFGISLLRSFPEICITEDSINWHKEAKSYKWKEKDGVKLNEPVKAFDHCWDAARYYAEEFVAQGGGDGYA